LNEQPLSEGHVPQLNVIPQTVAVPHSNLLAAHCCNALHWVDEEGDGATGDLEAEAAVEREMEGLLEAAEDTTFDGEAALEVDSEMGLDPIERVPELDARRGPLMLAAGDTEGGTDKEGELEGVIAGVLVAVEVVTGMLGMH
jgi:hypothetical protein